MTVSGAGFAKPAVEITLPWKYVCCTPSGVISGLPSLSRGSQRLGFTADANVSLSYPPSEALQLVSISVVCSLFVHHIFPSENCHIQAHGWSSYGGRLQPFHVWVLLPIPWYSWPPSDLLTRTMRFAKSAGLCIE